jgi:hypothetical protein
MVNTAIIEDKNAARPGIRVGERNLVRISLEQQVKSKLLTTCSSKKLRKRSVFTEPSITS